jgi:cupin superfamily acireductone dioxygenase involved in methionine salvage
MRAIEFNTKAMKNHILIPENVQSEFNMINNATFKVIVLFEDSDLFDEKAFKDKALESFLSGYSESDSVYDKY